jgi:Ig-like domain-containing protein
MAFNLPQYIIDAQFAQLIYAEKEANGLALNGTYTTPQYSRILSVLRQAVQTRYNRQPSDPTLIGTGELMYALSGNVNTTPNTIANPLIIVVNPISQTVTVGTVVSFTVAATGGTLPYTYQWIKDGSPIGGATNPSLTINPTTLGSAGAYDCIVTDANGQTVTSAIANLVVNASTVAVFAVPVPTDPFPLVSDTFTYTYTQNVPAVGDIGWNLLQADNDVNWWIFKEPIGNTPKIKYNNGTNLPNAGPIPDSLMRAPVILGGFRYYLSRIQFSYDATQPVNLTTT